VTLHVTGNADFTGNLTVANLLTTKDLAVSGEATVQHLSVTTGITLGASTEDPTTSEIAHPITKAFKASKPLTAGSVVILDTTAGNGWVTTGATLGSKLIIGVATQAAVNAGDTIQVAIGGTVKVKAQGTLAIGDLLRSDTQEGKASAVSR
jgi:hypothetical protein